MDRMRETATRDDDPWRYAAAYMIQKWVLDYGMAYEPGDVDLVAAAALDESEEMDDRINAAKVLRWFNNEAGNAWLRRLAERDIADPLRREARRLLRRKTLPTPEELRWTPDSANLPATVTQVSARGGCD